MSTTSLKLPDELKQRAAHAAEQQGKTAHAFMVEAIERAAALAELRSSFVNEAAASYKAAVKSGLGYDADEVTVYIRKRAAGKKAVRPKAKSWRS